MAIKIITDSTSCLPPKSLKEWDISIVSLSVIIDGKSQLETQMDLSAFYDQLPKLDKLPTSSQPSIDDLLTQFRDKIVHGHDIVGIFLSAAMSGTFSTAQLAKNMILEEYPKANIELIDSRTNCMEMGFVVEAAAKAAQAQKSMEEVLRIAKDTMCRTRFIFAPYTLEFLKKGGRIGNASSLVADILKIKPVLTVVDGVTTTLSKIRTHKKALEFITQTFLADIKTHGLSDAIVHHIHCPVEALRFSEYVESLSGFKLPIIPIGAVIGTHVGPGTIGLAYCTKDPLRV